MPHAPSAIIIDRVTGRVLYGRGIHTRRPMASTTKIMTALLALERFPELGKHIVAPRRVTVESGIGLRPGEHITVRQALLALMLRSAQDAGVTLAFAVSGSEEAFVARMNARARALGLRDTHYTNACGNVTDPSHFSSVFDLARLSRRAMHDARFRDIVGRQHAVVKWGNGRRVTVRSNNLLLHWDWADGDQARLHVPVRGSAWSGPASRACGPSSPRPSPLRTASRTPATTWRCTCGRRRCTRSGRC